MDRNRLGLTSGVFGRGLGDVFGVLPHLISVYAGLEGLGLSCGRCRMELSMHYIGAICLSRNSKAESRGSKHKTGGEVESGIFLKGSYT